VFVLIIIYDTFTYRIYKSYSYLLLTYFSLVAQSMFLFNGGIVKIPWVSYSACLLLVGILCLWGMGVWFKFCPRTRELSQTPADSHNRGSSQPHWTLVDPRGPSWTLAWTLVDPRGPSWTLAWTLADPRGLIWKLTSNMVGKPIQKDPRLRQLRTVHVTHKKRRNVTKIAIFFAFMEFLSRVIGSGLKQ
jgi:hypothetical protein